MASRKIKGIILRKTNFSDNDIIFDVLSDDGEIIGFFARGARKMKSKFSGVLQLGMIVDITYSTGKNLNYPEEISIDHKNVFSFYGKSLSYMNFYTDLLSITRGISKDLENPELYENIKSAFDKAESGEDVTDVYNEFLINALEMIGVDTQLKSYYSGNIINEPEFYYIPTANKVFSIEDKPKSVDAERISYDNIFQKNYLKNLLYEHVSTKLNLKF